MAASLKEVTEVKAVASANSLFSADVLNALQDTHPKNLIYSPFSLSTVIAMVRLGAVGPTAEEIVKALKFPQDDAILGNGYSKVLASFQEASDGYTLLSANRLYAKTGFGIKDAFAKSVKENFLAEIEQLDFEKSVESATAINSFVESTTQGKIKDLIPADALNSLTRLVLVNAVYFKGLWKDQFDCRHTRKAPFYLNDTDKVEVDMMYKEAKFPYGEFPDLDSHAIAIPYKGDRLCMIIIVPKTKTGLAKIEVGLKKYKPEDILSNLYEGDKVALKLPKFKLESTLQLIPMLQKLGISAMFSRDRADFSGIPENNEYLFVSEVIQKAFIEVNEEGSEAAAATGVVMMLRCMPILIPFEADRPFLFQIVDRHTNFVLFTGRCYNPLD